MSNQNEMSADLAEQIAMLGVDVNDVIANTSKPENPANAGIVTNNVTVAQPAAKLIETAETLRGEVEFGTVTNQTVAKPAQQVVQQQVNQQASAQVVQPATTTVSYQTVSKPATAVAPKMTMMN